MTEEDIKVLVSWMEIPPNRESIYGSDKNTTIGGKPKEHAATVGELREKFRETQKLELGTGMGLTPSELERGISLPAKVEKLCPCYHRIKVVISDCSNIKPHSTLELGSVVSPSDGDLLVHEGAVPGLRVQAIADEFAKDEAGSADFFKANSDTASSVTTVLPNPIGAPGKKASKKTMLTTKEKTLGQTEEKPQPPEKKPTPPSAHETHEKQAALKQQTLDDFEERRTARKQAGLLELIRQNKTLEEIAVLMKMAE
ncbi:hypothetical protein PHMEG_00036132 [Phytophthora megakarya]|uniref:Uncharacterized protein n=1 Tax=Phytophthora megakarya TaxID=4795 RepID=A0A225UMM3_9STRA|nr:hypothetical protein PHMEG_00036132 [Phytophthora megakarya]